MYLSSVFTFRLRGHCSLLKEIPVNPMEEMEIALTWAQVLYILEYPLPFSESTNQSKELLIITFKPCVSWSHRWTLTHLITRV